MATALPQKSATREKQAVEARAGRAVLVVEDDPDQQWRLARMLTVSGNRVVGTSTGDGALALLAEWPVDLVLIAADLPDMSGLALMRKIHEQRPKIRVLMMTTGAQETPSSAAMKRAGAAGCIAKPLEADTLAKALGTISGRA